MDEGDRALAMISTACLLVVLIFSVGHHVGWGRGQAFGTRESRIEAIKAGAGEWVVDETGKTEFRWKGTK